MKNLIALSMMLYSLSGLATEVLFVGDTGKDNENHARVSSAIARSCQTEACTLGLLAGDNVYHEGLTYPEDPILEKVFDKHYKALGFPFLVTLGNHDYGKIAKDWKRGEWQLKHSEKNPQFYIPHYWYIHETPEAVFAVLDTNRIYWKKDRTVQKEMLIEAEALAKKENKWLIVVGHHPYLSNGEHGNAGKYEGWIFPYFVSGSEIKKFVEKNVCGKADFYLSGHDHNLQVFDGNIAECDTRFIVSGAGADTTPLEARNKAEFQSEALGFFRLTLTKEELRVRAIDAELNVLFDQTYKQ